MATRRMHAVLTSREFPHNFAELGSTVVVSTPFEQNRTQPNGFSGEGAEQSQNVCQAYFMQNVLPTLRGYSSVSFKQMLQPIAGETEIAQLHVLRGAGQNVAMHAAVGNKQYVYDPTVGGWLQFPLTTIAVSQVYVAYVKERTFVFFPDLGEVYEYNFSSQEMELVAFPALNLVNMRGICSAGAYLIFWDSNKVYWSSVLDPTDFTPSLATGAGSTGVLAVRGELVTCASLADGFVIYTASNAVSARQTGNLQFPFIFKEIAGSAGLASRYHIADNSNTGLHLVWTASGFQQVSADRAEYAFAEFSDGIIRGILSELDPYYLRPTLNRYSGLDVRVSFASNRWIAISLRTTVDAAADVPFRFAYVYDTQLGRWGRIDVDHRQIMEFSAPEFYQYYSYQELANTYPTYADLAGIPYSEFFTRLRIAAPQPGENFGVVTTDGALYRCALAETEEFEPTNELLNVPMPRIYLGKFKMYRTQGAKLQTLRLAGAFDVTVRAHGHGYDGNFVVSGGELTQHPRQPGTFSGRLNADSFTVELAGTFHLTDMVLEATDAGMRNQRFRAENEDVAAVFAGEDQVYVAANQVIVEVV